MAHKRPDFLRAPPAAQAEDRKSAEAARRGNKQIGLHSGAERSINIDCNPTIHIRKIVIDTNDVVKYSRYKHANAV